MPEVTPDERMLGRASAVDAPEHRRGSRISARFVESRGAPRPRVLQPEAQREPDRASEVSRPDRLRPPPLYFAGGSAGCGFSGCGALKYFSSAISK